MTVRVGQAVDVVAQAGKPKTITGFQTHTTPVLLAYGERAELANEECEDIIRWLRKLKTSLCFRYFNDSLFGGVGDFEEKSRLRAYCDSSPQEVIFDAPASFISSRISSVAILPNGVSIYLFYFSYGLWIFPLYSPVLHTVLVELFVFVCGFL